jgi:hypothetical protein
MKKIFKRIWLMRFQLKTLTLSLLLPFSVTVLANDATGLRKDFLTGKKPTKNDLKLNKKWDCKMLATGEGAQYGELDYSCGLLINRQNGQLYNRILPKNYDDHSECVGRLPIRDDKSNLYIKHEQFFPDYRDYKFRDVIRVLQSGDLIVESVDCRDEPDSSSNPYSLSFPKCKATAYWICPLNEIRD